MWSAVRIANPSEGFPRSILERLDPPATVIATAKAAPYAAAVSGDVCQMCTGRKQAVEVVEARAPCPQSARRGAAIRGGCGLETVRPCAKLPLAPR